MDSKAQAEGEARVKAMLVEPLLNSGLGKPGHLTKERFEAMLEEVCQKLAYMDAVSLAALAEEAPALAGGKARDRFPLATVLLPRGAEIKAPPDDGSPLMRAVFAHGLGQDALAQGWAPELLRWLRKNRRWPNAYVLTQLRQDAESAIRQLREFEGRLAREGELEVNAARWRDDRRALIARCEALAELGRADRVQA